MVPFQMVVQTQVPPQQSVRGHEGTEVVERSPAQAARFGRETAALLIGESRPPVADLLAESPVLLLEVLDHVLLTAVQPGGNGADEELQR
jgi:hypothetical protein